MITTCTSNIGQKVIRFHILSLVEKTYIGKNFFWYTEGKGDCKRKSKKRNPILRFSSFPWISTSRNFYVWRPQYKCDGVVTYIKLWKWFLNGCFGSRFVSYINQIRLFESLWSSYHNLSPFLRPAWNSFKSKMGLSRNPILTHWNQFNELKRQEY